jgi:MerR family regulatory protein
MKISIGELSRRTGVKVATIRYYESIALMSAPSRSEGKQRRYSDPTGGEVPRRRSKDDDKNARPWH